MRISTNTVYESGLIGILQRQQEQLKLQQQVTTGRRVLTPSDDPIAAAAALEITQAKGLQQQYQTNIESARTALTQEEQALGDVTRLLQDVRVVAVNAGNAVLRNEDRSILATELQGRYQELLGIANRTDGNGQYLFSGYKGSTQPFSELSSGVVTYSGDEGQRLMQIGASRRMPVSDSGSTIFQAVREGNKTFATVAATGNTGTGVISGSTVTNPLGWNGVGNSRNFSISFHVNSSVTPMVTTYDIIDNVNNVSKLTGVAPAAGPHLRSYVPDAAINLKTVAPPDTNATAFDYGAQVMLNGAPANGDSFTVRASATRDVFAIINDLITALRTGQSGSAVSATEYQNRLNTTLANIDNALDNVLTVRTTTGIRLAGLDSAQGFAEEAVLNHEQNLSQLQDLDYARALSNLAEEQAYLEAAQKSFIKITSLRLFDFI